MSERVYKFGGRKSFYLAATPDEIARILHEGGFHMLVTNTHVPKDYIETPFEEWLSTNRALYEKLASGARLSWNEDWSLFDIRHLTRDSSLCVWEGEHMYQGHIYKKAPYNYMLRCLCVEPFVLYRETHEGQAATYSKAYGWTQFPESTVGLQFSVATKRWWWDEADLTHEEDITDMPDFADWQWLKERFEKITKPLTFEDERRIVNTGIRVTPDAKEALKQFFFFADKRYHII